MKEIAEALAPIVGDWFGVGAALDADSYELRKYPNSFMLRYHVHARGSRPVLLVKIPRKPAHRSIEEALQNEYLLAHTREYFAAMLAIWEAFEQAADSRCFAVRPLDYLRQWNAIVMLEADGRLLKNLVWRRNEFFYRSLANAARWLKIYHERIGLLQEEIVPRAAIESQVDDLLADLSLHARGGVDITSLRTALLAALKNDWQLPVARTHADYHYSNVLVAADGRACGLDARRRSRRDPIYADLATLLLDPETRMPSILSGGLFISRRFLARTRQVVLDGYFAGQPLDEAVLDFYCALAVLDKWKINERRLNSASFRFTGFIVRPLMRNYFSGLLARYLAIPGWRISVSLKEISG